MKISLAQLQAKKNQHVKISMLTSYDFPTACIEDACGIDVQLVGDSLGTNVLGYSDVCEVTMEDMVHHVKAVARGAKRSFVLCDMPFHSFLSPRIALDNARRLIDAGADGVKIEGEEESVAQVECVVAAGIPVCAHIGYTPQTDGVKASVQGKDLVRAQQLVDIALQLEKAGAGMIVLELIPLQLAAEITRLLTIPTIGIGAGMHCDGQVQVVHDITGLSQRIYRHAKAYASTGTELTNAIGTYISEVTGGQFPTVNNAASLPEDINLKLRQWIDSTQKERVGHGHL